MQPSASQSVALHIPLDRPVWGVAFLIASSVCFVGLDIATQRAVGAGVAAALPIFMAVFARYAVQAGGMALWLVPSRGKAAWATAHPKFQLARGGLLTLTSVLGMLGLKHLPIAEFTAIVMLTPLAVSLLATRLLGERLRPVQWALLWLSFGGALVVARPGGAVFSWTLLYPLGSLLCYSGFQLLTRKLAQTEDPLVMHLYTGWVGALATSVALPFVWQTPLPAQWLQLLLIGLCGTVGHYFLIQAFRRAEASRLAPFLYAQVVLAVLGGWLAFGRVPDGITLAGIALILAGGVCSALVAARLAQRA